MRQGDGSDFLDAGDPRRTEIGIVYVEAMDSRQEILTEINLLNMQGRKQIVLELTEARKVFQQSVDFDGLKQARRDIKAQLIIVAPSGSSPAELARSRHFPVYSSLVSLKHLFVPSEQSDQPAQPQTTGRHTNKKLGFLAFGSSKARPNRAMPKTVPISGMPGQQQPNAPAPPTPQASGSITKRTPRPAPTASGQATPPSGPLSPLPSTPKETRKPALPKGVRPITPNVQDDDDALYAPSATPQDISELPTTPPTPPKKGRTNKLGGASQEVIVFPGGTNKARAKTQPTASPTPSGSLPTGQGQPNAPVSQPLKNKPSNSPLPQTTTAMPAASGPLSKNKPASQPLQSTPASSPLPQATTPFMALPDQTPPQATTAMPAISGQLPKNKKPASSPLPQATSQFAAIPGQTTPRTPADPTRPASTAGPAISGQLPKSTLPLPQPATPFASGANPNAPNTPPSGSTQRGGTGKIAAIAAAGAGAAIVGSALASGAATPAAPGRPTPSASPNPSSAPNVSPRPMASQTRLPPLRPTRGGSSQGGRRRALIIVGALLVLLLIIGVWSSASGSNFSNILPGSHVSATITLTPNSRLEQNNYIITALPHGTLDPANRQVPARIITLTSQTQTATGNATGSIAPRAASGTLTFQNVGGSGVSVNGGVLTGADGTQISFGSVFVPATGSASVNVTGHAVKPGAAGNIRAFDLDGNCCGNANIFVKNQSAFSGGQDPVPNTVIQQSDIDGAAKPLITSLTQSTQNSLQQGVKANERVVNGTLSCTPTTTADQQVGAVVKAVHVSVAVTCQEEVYDATAVQQMAVSLLLDQAKNDTALNAQYTEVGQTVTNVLSVVNTNGKISVEMQTQGLWVYQFTPQMQQNMKSRLVKLSLKSAQSVLQHWLGVAQAKISLSSGTTLPDNVNDMTLTVLNVPGVQQATPGGTNPPNGNNGTPSAPTPTPALTPEPTNNLGGS